MKRILGKSGIEISAMGLGCWAIGGPFWWENEDGSRGPMGWGDTDDKESVRAIHAAMDAGITFFDTANNYGAGHSERVLGEATNGRRDQVVIATKFGSNFDEAKETHFNFDAATVIDEAYLRDAVEGSLRRLNVDYIDLYQLHRGRYEPALAEDLMGLLEMLVDEGKIRAYGWSTDHVDRAEIFAAGKNCASIQSSFNVFMPIPEMLALAEKHNLASINKHPLASGTLTGKFHADYQFPENDLRHGIDWRSERGRKRLALTDAVRDVLTSHGRTMAQGALAYIWARSDCTIPIPGFKSVEQVRENAGAMEFGPLSSEQVSEIQSILDSFEEGK